MNGTYKCNFWFERRGDGRKKSRTNTERIKQRKKMMQLSEKVKQSRYSPGVAQRIPGS